MLANEIITFGCRLNAFESERIARAAAAAGLEGAVIVNTCAVTAEAERQARQAIRRARRLHPEARIIVTGCAAEITPDRYAAMSEVDCVLGNEAKLRAESYGRIEPRAAARAEETPSGADSVSVRARAAVQVQQGCDHRCTFCVIPYARGASRSVPPAAVIAETRRLVRSGCREIVLTGVDLTAYGADLAARPSLGGLVRQVLDQVPELPRLMPHLHLSLQAGDDLILKRMKRRHSRAQAIAVAGRARTLRPEMALGADLIAGFPTETEDMFRRSLDFVGECGLTFVHVFPYSARPGTPAARMPPVPEAVVRERARRLREVAAAALAAALEARIGAESDVLVEQPGRGRAAFYASVTVPEAAVPGTVRRMRLVASDGRTLVGEPVP